jgi:esterase/lipase superfamily enzyme
MPHHSQRERKESPVMPIYFATNRDVVREGTSNAELGERFNADGPQFFRVGECEVALQPGREPTDDDGFRVTATNLYREQTTSRSEPRPRSGDLFEELRALLRDEGRDVLVYVHGFASTFEDSIARAAALEVLYNLVASNGPDPLVFVFSWPANGRTFPATEYFSDRDDAKLSGTAMARALLALLRFMEGVMAEDRAVIRAARERNEVPSADTLKRCQGRMHLLAHSMGNWALRHTVLSIRDALGVRPLPRLFKNVFLVAADEDADVLGDENKLGLLFELCQNVHVYHSIDDQALQISDTTKGNPDRLGADGPDDLTNLPPRVFVVDSSEVDETAFEHGRHQYYRIRAEVIGDIKQVLEGVGPEQIKGREPIIPGRSWRILRTD